MKVNNYKIRVEWTVNKGNGTLNDKSYSRNHNISSEEKHNLIHDSSDPSFSGERTKYNPEELFISSISACHMLWYLHLCSINKIVVTEYIDNAKGFMEETENSNGKFTEVILNPTVKITDPSSINKANKLHTDANGISFIAKSCNFKIKHKPNTILR